MAARIITFFNQKGGVGKTRLSTETAGTLGWMGHKTLLADLDRQGTAIRIVSQADEESPFPATCTNLSQNAKPHTEIHKHIEDYDFIVIDCPPNVEKESSTALLISDIAIIPVGGSAEDLWASHAAKQLALHAQIKNPSLKIRTVSNNANPKTVLARDVIAELERDEEIPLMKTRIGSRNALKETAALGKVAPQMFPRSNTARREIEALTEEILEILA